MDHRLGIPASEAFRSAFRVAPDVAANVDVGNGLGIYGWQTPEMDGFELPETEELVIALHLGGSRDVRAVTSDGLSRTRSAPGLITLIPAGRPVAFRTQGRVSLMTLHLPRPVDSSDPLARLLSTETPRFAFRDPYVSSAMQALLNAARDDASAHREYLSRVSEALLCHLAMLAERGRTPLAPLLDRPDQLGTVTLQELVRYVDAHLGAKLSLDQLATRAGMSRTQFTQRFKDATGLPAHQFLTQRRIETAKRLLTETDLDLAHIAQETGFSSQSHFTGQFHALTGVTPRVFRERR